MAKKPEPPKTPVRYKVLEQCFVNGSLFDPKSRDGQQTYILAAPGLEGAALELAPLPPDTPPDTPPPEPKA